MIAIPAIDLREGACVQLVGGSYADERVRLDDPVAVAQRWTHVGFSRLHVVDLDAATGRGDNDGVIADLLRQFPGDVQVGGGVRSTSRVEELLARGARAVVVGTRAVDEPAWLADLASSHPGAIIVAADVRNRTVLTKGWTTVSPRDVTAFVRDIAELPLAGLLVTAVHREGLMQGPDVRLVSDVAEHAQGVPVIASGGIRSRNDLDALSDAGAAAAVIGMALYTGAIDPHLVAEEYSA
jgi:phosphoribosylformimino-5-aminoimidazole carboxamide ribotide isomerase